MSDVTAILLNYRRPKNIPVLVGALRTQSVRPVIWLVNNSPDMIAADVDRMAWLPWNGGCFARLLMAAYVETEWVLFMDDDVAPVDDRCVARMIDVAIERGAFITGLYGQALGPPPNRYSKKQVLMGRVPLVKGPAMLFRRALLDRVNLAGKIMAESEEYRKRCDDLYLSLELGRGYAAHWADWELQNTVRELPGADVGLCRDPGHYALRNQFCCHYLRSIAS